MAESVVRSAHACGFEREWRKGTGRGERRRKLVGPVHGKERKGKNGIRLRKEISFGVEAEEKEEKKDGKKR